MCPVTVDMQDGDDMRNRSIQRWLKKNVKEKPLKIRDEAGILDPTAYEAVLSIVKEEKKELIKRYFEAVYKGGKLNREDEKELQSILDGRKGCVKKAEESGK